MGGCDNCIVQFTSKDSIGSISGCVYTTLDPPGQLVFSISFFFFCKKDNIQKLLLAV